MGAHNSRVFYTSLPFTIKRNWPRKLKEVQRQLSSTKSSQQSPVIGLSQTMHLRRRWLRWLPIHNPCSCCLYGQGEPKKQLSLSSGSFYFVWPGEGQRNSVGIGRLAMELRKEAVAWDVVEIKEKLSCETIRLQIDHKLHRTNSLPFPYLCLFVVLTQFTRNHPPWPAI